MSKTQKAFYIRRHELERDRFNYGLIYALFLAIALWSAIIWVCQRLF